MPLTSSNNFLSFPKRRSSSLRQHYLPPSTLVWNWIADPLVLSGRDVIWDSGNHMLRWRRQLLQDTKGSEMTLDFQSPSLWEWKSSQQISRQHKKEELWRTTNRNTQGFFARHATLKRLDSLRCQEVIVDPWAIWSGCRLRFAIIICHRRHHWLSLLLFIIIRGWEVCVKG